MAGSTRVDRSPFISLSYSSPKKHLDELGDSMEIIFERLLLELALVAAQFAIMRIVNWILEQSPSSAGPATQVAA